MADTTAEKREKWLKDNINWLKKYGHMTLLDTTTRIEELEQEVATLIADNAIQKSKIDELRIFRDKAMSTIKT